MQNTISVCTQDFFMGMESQRAWFMARARRRSIRKGGIIYSEGGTNSHCFYIAAGTVRIFRTTSGGKEAILFMHRSGALFGLVEALGTSRCGYTAQAVTPTTLYALNGADFNKLLESDNAFSLRVLRLVHHRFQYSLEQRASLMLAPVRQRLLDLLVHLSGEERPGVEPRGNSPVPTISFSEAQLAGMIGSTQSTISRFLRQLQREEILSLSRMRIRVVNPSALLRQAAHPPRA